MTFSIEKKAVLERIDKSRKQKIDEKIKSLVDHINSLDNYYTTSSCSGRMLIIARDQGDKKDARWLFSSHDDVSFDDILDTLKDLPKKPVWFKQEPFILHLCCKTIQDAGLLLQKARDSGIKRAGIISIGRKIIVEIIGTGRIEAIIADKGELLVNGGYIKRLVYEADKKMKGNLETLRGFYDII